VVAIGGGTGLSTLLKGLKRYVLSPSEIVTEPPDIGIIRDLCAVVTVSDDGGSSGRLRKELNMLPPGDILKCALALARDGKLWQEAWEKSILLVSPSTLLFVLRTVAHLWRQEQQKRNVQDIVKRGGELYDKLAAFAKDLTEVGKKLGDARDAYDEAYKKLAEGKGNVIRQAEMLKGLGVKTSKALPNALVDAAHDGDGLPAIANEADAPAAPANANDSRMNHRELLPIPPIETANDPVHSAADLRQRWRALVGPLGFEERLLWFGLIGPDRCFTKKLSQVQIRPRPQGRIIWNLMSALRTLLDDLGPGTTVALLLTGPGRGPVASADRVWSKTLTDMAERFAVPLEPIFRANDDSLELVG